jgi:hypothetical protein
LENEQTRFSGSERPFRRHPLNSQKRIRVLLVYLVSKVSEQNFQTSNDQRGSTSRSRYQSNESKPNEGNAME